MAVAEAKKSVSDPDPISAKPFRKLVEYIAEHDFLIFDAVPEDLRSDERSVIKAWMEGFIEFGRHSYIETGEKSSNNARAGTTIGMDGIVREIPGSATRYLIDREISWTGTKKTWHKSLRELLKEAEPFRPGCAIYEVQADGSLKKTNETKLKLLVRVTDKGLAALAA